MDRVASPLRRNGRSRLAERSLAHAAVRRSSAPYRRVWQALPLGGTCDAVVVAHKDYGVVLTVTVPADKEKKKKKAKAKKGGKSPGKGGDSSNADDDDDDADCDETEATVLVQHEHALECAVGDTVKVRSSWCHHAVGPHAPMLV